MYDLGKPFITVKIAVISHCSVIEIDDRNFYYMVKFKVVFRLKHKRKKRSRREQKLKSLEGEHEHCIEKRTIETEQF